MSLMLVNYGVAVACAVILFKYCSNTFWLPSHRPRNFPPGPPPLPFIGNDFKYRTTPRFRELAAEYGSIIGLKLGAQNVIVLNSYEYVRALYDRKGAIYSSRPHTYVANEPVCPNEIHLLLLKYGSEWRKQRKVVQSLLNVNAVDRMLPIQNAEATQNMFDILQDPNGYYDHIRRYTTAVILASVYGQRGARFDSPNVQALYHAQDQFTAILEQRTTPPVDTFPALKLLPDFLAPWKKWAKLTEWQWARAACFLHDLLRDQEKNELDDEHLAYLAGNRMEAGSDTTASTLLSFLLVMLNFPEEFRKAQIEVDEVCGATRPPNVDDIDSPIYSPFTYQTYQTLKWRPVAAGGVPHILTQDDFYQGYYLPKGTIFFANTWAIHRDESEYERPDDFIPKLVDENADDHRRVSYGFGAGRRVCPGQRLARNSLVSDFSTPEPPQTI
ncbi:cytochrome P450 [Xylariomycetidae sp. FL0641]|nr:cytochrome P450 [Xylariomycetidae sp. FL0641]